MKFRDNIIRTALLGTEKKQISEADFPEPLKEDINRILQEETDNETKFLKSSALALSYYKAGVQPLKLSFEPEESPEEKLKYCSRETIKLLREILRDKYYTLVWLWCKMCREKNLIVQPHLLPDLFGWGAATKKHSLDLFRSVIGYRGVWLSHFSKEWAFVRDAEEVADWDTGTLPQRLKYLMQLRMENPPAATEKIQSIWKEENAANRTDLLETLSLNISKTDEAFIMQAAADKSQRVKEKAWQLLKLIPGSQVISLYQDVLRDSIQISESKMLGLLSRINTAVKLKIKDEEIFRTGVSNLSNDKKISDDTYVLMQLVAEVPPSFWEDHFRCTPPEAVKLFESREELNVFRSSLFSAVIKFKDQAWSKAILGQFDNAPAQLLKVLNEEDRMDYAEKLVNTDVKEIADALRTTQVKDWSYKFCSRLLRTMAENPSSYNRNYVETISIYLPVAIISALPGFMPSDEWKRGNWVKTITEIKEFIIIKEKIKNIF